MKIKEANIMRQKSNEINKDELIKFINIIKKDIEYWLNYIYDNEMGSYTLKLPYKTKTYILKGIKNDLKKIENDLEKLGYEFVICQKKINDEDSIELTIEISW